jgi:hypothetical protein
VAGSGWPHDRFTPGYRPPTHRHRCLSWLRSATLRTPLWGVTYPGAVPGCQDGRRKPLVTATAGAAGTSEGGAVGEPEHGCEVECVAEREHLVGAGAGVRVEAGGLHRSIMTPGQRSAFYSSTC